MQPPTDRHALFADLHELMARMTQAERQPVLDQLIQWSGREPVCRETRRTLSTTELKQLAACNNIELGAHTISHPVLSQLDDAEQWQEIIGCKTFLEQAAETNVRSFAYPYGRRGDFTEKTVALVREAGFTNACCTVADVTWAGSDRYRLPRLPMLNCNPDLISDWLKLWF
jgi:peptidoglycan/xylan/chitin deacetylase (PgdA/CDA1 family)